MVPAERVVAMTTTNDRGKWNNLQSTGGSRGDSIWSTGNATGKRTMTAAMADAADAADAQWFYFDIWLRCWQGQ